MRRSWIRLLVLTMTLSLVAAACGSDGEGAATGDGGEEAVGVGVSNFSNANSSTDGATATEDDPANSPAGSAVDSADDRPGTSTGESPQTEDEAEGANGQDGCGNDDVLCVGLATDLRQPIGQDLNRATAEGARDLQSTMAATVDVVEVQDLADLDPTLADFVERGVDVVITVGPGFAEATRTAAAANPDTYFIGVDQVQQAEIPNLVGLLFDDDKVGFLAGAVAGLLTETGIVAQVLGSDLVEPVVALREGFEAGVAHTNSGADVISTYHPGTAELAFTDPEWGAIIAREALSNGADVIFSVGGSTGDGALTEVARERGLALCIGANTDRWETLPEAQPCLVTSAVKQVSPALESIIAAWAEGNAASGNFSGSVGLADYHQVGPGASEEVQAIIADLVPQVVSGAVPTGYGS